MKNRGGLKTRVRNAVLKYFNIEVSDLTKKELDIIIRDEIKKN